MGLEGGRPRAHGLTPKRLELGAPLAVPLWQLIYRSSIILLAGASLPRLFFDYLGQGFELGAKPIEMLFVPFVAQQAVPLGSARHLL